MLNRLVINDVVLIEKLVLPLECGLNVFTGETGAGKSIILDALSLAIGERSDTSIVRQEATQASVSAEFFLKKDHILFMLAQEQGLIAENPIILRRVINKDGKSRAFFNDQPISIGLLKQLGESLIEFHGQFETHGLLNATMHRGLLDAYAGLQNMRQETLLAFNAWKEMAEKLKSAQSASEQAQTEQDFLHAAVHELEQLAPQDGEADALALERVSLQFHEKILEALNAASQALDGERGALGTLSQAGKSVARVSDKAHGLADILATIDRATHEANEASQQLARFMSTLDAQPDKLQKTEERLFALRAAARKHNTQIENLPNILSDLSARLLLLNDNRRQMSGLLEDTVKARHHYVKLAEELSSKRQAAARKLEKAMSKELPSLKLERTIFTINFTTLAEEHWSSEGIDRVNFLASTNAGTPPGPLQKIASGGELARFMLALKTVLAAADPVPVLVFDEVDTGIGGAVASAVGERLAHLATTVQVLVVTHSPQVAARGAYHLRVIKKVVGKKTITEVNALDKFARREEIARMLAGTQVTDAARQAADSLLDEETEFSKKRVGNIT